MAVQTEEKRDDATETRKVTKEEAAFILGQGGKTKQKLCVVSGAQIDLAEGKGERSSAHLEIRGNYTQRSRAKKYIEFVIAQRVGPVKIDDPSQHEDLTLLVVPADTVSFITGKQGSFLRLIEDECGALLFFLQVNPKNPPVNVDPSSTERLAIFGPERRRRGAELKVMAAIENKIPGYFTSNLQPGACKDEGFGTDTLSIREEDYSYALGHKGSTRKKLARASCCLVEYVGRVAYFSGLRSERQRAQEYLKWLLQQKVGENIHVDHKGRDDVTVVTVPSTCLGFVSGHKGSFLRSIEDETHTFCFLENGTDVGDEQKVMMIFGRHDDRSLAESQVWDKMSTKVDEVANDHPMHTSSGKRGGKGKGGRGDYYNKGKGRNHGGDRDRDRDRGGASYRESTAALQERMQRPDVGSDSMAITDDDAAFLMGPNGKTKRKIAAVSGAYLELKTNKLEIYGTQEERDKAQKYVALVMAQRVRPVRLEDLEQHTDLSIIEVPAEAVSFVTGKAGSFLRMVEEEFGTLLFFIDFDKTNKRDQLERLAIFGSARERRGAELKVMAAIETKQPGYFAKRNANLPMQDPAEGFATDRMMIDEDDYSYALGKGGATRKKIARASSCVIEYIGRLAYLSGTRRERTRAREYLGWLFRQRVGPVEVDYACRDDVTVLQVPKDCVGFVTGHKGISLRAVEDATGTFCFIEGGRDDPHRDPKPLLIFGSMESRRNAEERLRQRIEQKLEEGWVADEWYNGYQERADRGEKGNGRHRDGPRRGRGGGRGGGTYEERSAYGGGNHHLPSPATVTGSEPPAQQEVLRAQEPEDEGAWGNWGGSSDDGEPNTAPAAGIAVSPGGFSGGTVSSGGSPVGVDARSTGYVHNQGHGPRWNPYPGYTQGVPAPIPPQRSSEELELPPQLLHEEAWPELGQMGGSQRKRR